MNIAAPKVTKMSQESEQEPLFRLEAGNSIKEYYLGYDKTPAANVNYKLLNKPDGEKNQLIVRKNDLPKHLQPEVEITVIDSIMSGTGRENRAFYKEILKPIFEELNIKHTLLETTSPDSITDFAKSIDLAKEQTVIILSGDTSVMELVNGLPVEKTGTKNNVNLVLIPLGTGNALASSAGLLSEAIAVQKIFSIESSPLPLYEVEFPEGSYAPLLEDKPIHKLLFSIVVSWGSHAQMVYHADSPELKKLGTERFKVAAGQIFQHELKYHCDILLLENEKEEKFSHSTNHRYSSILAVSNLEKLYRVSPDSQLKKNELHILDFGDIPQQEFLGLLVAPYQGRAHVDDERVLYEPISPEKKIALQIDEEDPEKAIICVDGISVKIRDAKGKRIVVSFVKPESLSYKLNFIGLN